MRTVLFFFLFVIPILTSGQELKRVTRSNPEYGEVYYVLKDNRYVKQGKYLKYYEVLFSRNLESFGQFDNNTKTGTWILFNSQHILNPLSSFGEFDSDKKIGQWEFFYSPVLMKDSLIKILASQKLTTFNIPQKDNEEIQILIDTAGIKLAAIGNYNDNQKTGIWEYYSRDGALLCKYDYSSNQMIQNNNLNSYDQLGGVERFKTLFSQSISEKRAKSSPFFFNNSHVTFEITTNHDSLNIKKIDSLGDFSFDTNVEQIIRNMSLDWINYDPRLEHNNIKIQINYFVNGRTGSLSVSLFEPFDSDEMTNK